MHLPGIEPGSHAWKACMLTITPQVLIKTTAVGFQPTPPGRPV